MHDLSSWRWHAGPRRQPIQGLILRIVHGIRSRLRDSIGLNRGTVKGHSILLLLICLILVISGIHDCPGRPHKLSVVTTAL